MSYEAFSRKYRPKDFSQVIGQEPIVQTLKNAIDLDRVSHAYIFAGSRGIGKTTISRILAKCLNCEKGITSEPCNKCENCLEIEKGSFPDLYEIDAASNRGIDDIRNLRDNIGYAPIKGRYKVYIIDEAHMLTREAFNALLKTLEEPPPRNIFILATTELHKIPDTIKSRCQTFLFKQPNVSQILKLMKEILEKENVPYEEEALKILAEESEGGVRDSASLLDQAVTFGEGKITVESVEKMLGIVPKSIVSDFMKNLEQKNIQELLKTIITLDKEGSDLNIFWKQVLNNIHNQLVEKVLSRKEENIEDLIYIQSIFEKAYSEAKASFNPKNIYTLAVLKLQYVKDLKPLSEVIKMIKSGNIQTASPEQSKTKQTEKKTETKKEETFDLSKAILKAGKEAGGIVASTLKKVKIEEKEDKFIFNADETLAHVINGKIDIIQKYFPKPIEIKATAQKMEKKSKTKKRDEAVDKILDLFQGKIISYKEE